MSEDATMHGAAAQGYAVVDAGTSSTRVRWWKDGRVRWSGSRPVGARDTAVDGHDGKLRGALGELLAALRSETGAEPQAVVCSGMITSNMGLHELPHLPAPAGFDAIAAGIRQVDFPELWPRPLAFVPGVKTLPTAGAGATPAAEGRASAAPFAFDGLEHGDVLRGEEAEIAGLRPLLGLDRASVFLHVGSHHKVIEVAADGAILGSRSAITGELLAAVQGHTILKSSTVALDGLAPDPEAVLAGADAALRHGLGRALFLVRVGEQQAGLGREGMTSYLLGALAALDLPLLAGAAPDTPVLVYGTGLFPALLARLLPAHGWRDVRLLPLETADLAAADGAVLLYRRAQALGVVP